MQKINIFSLVKSHVLTLRDDANRLCVGDILTFFVAPIAAGAFLYFMKVPVPEKVLELSISVFSIFAALLLSVQVALYSVSLREPRPPEDEKKLKQYELTVQTKKTLLKELNDNVSYLILLSVITVTMTLIMFFFCQPHLLWSSIVVALYSHFFLTLLMVIKRASIVFSREYDT